MIQAGDVDDDRRAWVLAQLAGIDVALSCLEGAAIPYRELVRRCYGVEPVVAPDSQFAAAHDLLAASLPGRGDVGERYRRWFAGQRVPPDRLALGIGALVLELRRRTRELVAMPPEEETSIDLVSGELWWGYADYVGGFRTRIRLNTDVPISAGRLLELVSHESYPGHHTEHVCKEAMLIRRAGRSELAVYVHCTPQAMIAEGIALLACEALLGGRIDEVAADVLEPFGISYDMQLEPVNRRAEEMLLPLRQNAAIMLDEGCSEEEVRVYARRWLLGEDAEVDRTVESLIAPDWLPYESCYPEGLALCRRFTRGDPSRFRRLLQSQLTTAGLGSA